MPSSENIIDRSALISAWLTKRKCRNAHEDLRSYHDAVYAAFAKAFGIDLEVSPVAWHVTDRYHLHELLLNVAKTYENVDSPFSGYMCATIGISEMYQKYHEHLDGAAASLRHVHFKMMVDLIERVWGAEVPRRISRKQLEKCGHPEGGAPDPVDYW